MVYRRVKQAFGSCKGFLIGQAVSRGPGDGSQGEPTSETVISQAFFCEFSASVVSPHLECLEACAFQERAERVYIAKN